jgi:hypothetical protein
MGEDVEANIMPDLTGTISVQPTASASNSPVAGTGLPEGLNSELAGEDFSEISTATNQLEALVEADVETSQASALQDTEVEQHIDDGARGTLTHAANADAASLGRLASSSAVAEKIAAHLSRVAERVAPADKTSQRFSLDAGAKEVATSYGRIGINVAKPEALMPATASTPTPAQVETENQTINSMPLSLDSLVKEGGENAAGQVTQAARRAVEAVLSIADQTIATDQRTVRLQFTVGGEELAVRVELRGENVHTTFRTDSPDLRIALAHEWQSVSATQNGGRTQRLADPVFASNSSGSGNGMSSDSGAAHHRDSSPRHPHATSEELFGIRRAAANTQTVSTAAVVPAVNASSGLNPLRLHTFA